MHNNKLTLGIVGAGKLGVTLGNLAVNAGYNVYISSRKSVKHIALTVEILVAGAKATTNEEIGKLADIIILALPLSKYQNLDPNLFANKIVIDAMNYWWEVDGMNNLYSDLNESSSEKVANYFKDSKVVKAFNHIGYHHLNDYATNKEDPQRKAIAFATSASETVVTIVKLIDDLGFTPLYIGELANGRILESGEPSFGALLSLQELKALIDRSLNEK